MSDFEFGPRHKWEKVFGPIPLNWKYEKLDKFITRKDQVSEKSEELPLCSLTIEAGVTEKTERYNREFLLNDAESNEYKVVEPGDFVINPMNLRFGAVAQSKKSKSVLVSAYYDIFSVDGPLDASFLEANLTSSRFMYIYDVVATGSLIEKRRVHFSQFKNLALPLPPLSEQSKIAEIIATWDKSIEATERLLENSRKRKMALMQQLLTGKKRLPGFKQPWSTTKLSTLCEIRRGASPRPISDPSYFSDSGRGWVRISDVTSDETPFFRKTSQYLSPLGESKSVKVDDGDLIMSICATIGVPKFVKIPACIHDGFVVFRNPSDSLSLNLLYYVIQFITDKLDGEGQPGTQRNLNTSIVGEIQFPKITTEEQEMIAEIFKLADSSIGAINERLKSLRKEKDALMQQLLTGKKRVFTSEAI